jgi:predicted XRE-type DNA-binding protein
MVVRGMRVKVTPSTGNVFRDVGFSGTEAAHLKLRADLLIEAQRAITRRGLTQAAAAKILGVHPPRVSDLMRGRIELFSIETLVDMLARLGRSVKLVTARSRKRAGAA